MNDMKGARAHAIDSPGSKRSNVTLEWVVTGLAEAGSLDGIVRPGSATLATARACVAAGSKAELNFVLFVNLVVKR